MTTLLWQLYDPQGLPVRDGGAAKLKAIMEGTLHGSAHVWIWRRTPDGIEVLVQKRAANKINWPGLLDKSAGGHITYGQDPIETVIRKAEEELGLTLMPEQLRLVGVCRWNALVGETDIVENEFQWVYTAELANPRVSVPTPEVEAVMWKPLADILSQAGGSSMGQFVPYGQPYFQLLGESVTRTER